jgi:hypothetical protein
MTEEGRLSQNSYFLTLTYHPKYVPRVKDREGNTRLTLRKKHLFTFLDTLKSFQHRHLSKQDREQWKIKYYACGEYGSEEFTTRPHYHLIVFNLHQATTHALREGKIWPKGIVETEPVNGGAASYCAKYIIDRKPMNDEDPREPTFSTMSRGRNKGIGANYLNTNQEWHRAHDEYNPDTFRIYRMENGYFKRLPRYYKKSLKIAKREDRQEILDMAFEIYNEDMLKRTEEQYKKEIERLSKLHPEPEKYYTERLHEQYEKVRIKSLEKNKL